MCKRVSVFLAGMAIASLAASANAQIDQIHQPDGGFRSALENVSGGRIRSGTLRSPGNLVNAGLNRASQRIPLGNVGFSDSITAPAVNPRTVVLAGALQALFTQFNALLTQFENLLLQRAGYDPLPAGGSTTSARVIDRPTSS